MLDLDLDKLLPRPLQFALLGALTIAGLATGVSHIASAQIEPLQEQLNAHRAEHKLEKQDLFKKLDDLQVAVTNLEIHLAAMDAREARK